MVIPAPVSSSFCVPHVTHLVVTRNSELSAGQFTVSDEQGSDVFNIRTKGAFVWTAKRMIHDAASGEVILFMKKKTRWFGRPSSWVALRGDSSEGQSQKLFTLKKKRPASPWAYEVQFFPENDHDSSSLDFTTEGNSESSKFTVLSDGTPIAEARKSKMGMARYRVKVYPGVDRVYISTLMICWMLDHLNND